LAKETYLIFVPAAVTHAAAAGERNAVGTEEFAGEFHRLKAAADFAAGISMDVDFSR